MALVGRLAWDFGHPDEGLPPVICRSPSRDDALYAACLVVLRSGPKRHDDRRREGRQPRGTDPRRISRSPRLRRQRRRVLEAMDATGIRAELAGLTAQTSPDEPESISAAGHGRGLVRQAGLPNALVEELNVAYAKLCDQSGGDDIAVAVRSSATSEDTAGTSFAGMHRTFTNVLGREQLAEAVLSCWESLWGNRAVAYRAARGVEVEPAIAVVVQRMLVVDRSGVAFTVDPSNGDANSIVIEGAYGQGEVVVSGQVEPDTYVVSREPRACATCQARQPDDGDRAWRRRCR